MASLITRGAGASLRLPGHRVGPSNGRCLVYNLPRNGNCCLRELVRHRKCISRGDLFVCGNASAEATRSGLRGAANRLSLKSGGRAKGFFPRKQRNKIVTNAGKRSNVSAPPAENKPSEVEQEEEVELSWVDERVEDLVQYTSTAVRAIPGPRVGDGEVPWLLALPASYMVLTLVIAIVKTVRNYNAPKTRRRRQVGKNALLVESLGEYLPAKREELDSETLKRLGEKSQFDTAEILRKYIRYGLNERPFDPELVADLIHLRKVSLLDDKSVAEILNEVSRRIVKAKGPVVVDTTGFTEKGLKRKVAVQALFSKILYLSELDEFCSTKDRSSLSIKEIFGVTDEDTNLIRIETLSGAAEAESLENLVGSSPDEDLDEEEK